MKLNDKLLFERQVLSKMGNPRNIRNGWWTGHQMKGSQKITL